MKPNETEKKKNIFRDTPLRFLGYANEVGESFRPLIPLKLVISTYVVSGFYVFADSLFIGLNSYNLDVSENRKISFLVSFSKCLLWQLLATELLPGFIVYKIVKIAKFSKKYLKLKNETLSKWFPTLVGLSFIPTFPYTVDPFVDYCMEYCGITSDKGNVKL